MKTLPGRKLDDSGREVRTVDDLLPYQEENAVNDHFCGLIGYDYSLRDTVEKGRVAVFPPHNLKLFSSHLFGHRQRAFTDASEKQISLVEQADGGYLLLEEVHRLPRMKARKSVTSLQVQGLISASKNRTRPGSNEDSYRIHLVLW